MYDIADPAPSRRRILGSTTLGAAAGLLTGLAAGVALALPPKAAPVPTQPGRRRFDGKVVVITGATSGIGRAAALAFAAEGGKVAFASPHRSRPGGRARDQGGRRGALRRRRPGRG
jgi:NADPH:quinone reductase-like Zn-dependent oxidoreductase